MRNREGRLASTGPTASLPAIMSFIVTPQQISRGDRITVEWHTIGVGSVTLAWGSEGNPRDSMQERKALPPSGNMTFQPLDDTIFVLECEPVSLQACRESVSVRVK